MNEEPKLCPLCGEIPFIWKDVSGLVAECGDPHCALFQEPICFGVWQKRPIEDKLQARIAELEQQLNDLCPVGGLDALETWRVEKSHMQERIAELEAERRWIPVSERLPEEERGEITSKPLWFLTKEGVGYGYRTNYLDRDWYDTELRASVNAEHVIAWCYAAPPIPKPPKSEE